MRTFLDGLIVPERKAGTTNKSFRLRNGGKAVGGTPPHMGLMHKSRGSK